MPDRRGVNRLSFLDDAYFTGATYAGVAMQNQWIWRFDNGFELERAQEIFARLQAGPLSRLVQRAGFPGARNRWIPAPPTNSLLITQEPVTDAQAWANEMARYPLDLVRGPAWAMAYATLADGGNLVMIMASHAVCDGTMLFRAVTAAVTGESVGILPDDSRDVAQVRRRDDVRDALRQARDAGRALKTGLRLYRNGSLQEAVLAARQPLRPGEVARKPDRALLRAARAAGRDHFPPQLTLTVPADKWNARAAESGGTSNSLFLAICTGLLERMGRIGEGEVLRVSTPVDGTTEDSTMRANNTMGITLQVEVRADRYQDLTPIRAEAKKRYVGLADGSEPNVMVPLRPLMQLGTSLTPKRLMKNAALGAQMGVCTASNLGKLSDVVAGLGGPPADSVLSRGVITGLTEADLRASRGGISVWVNQCDNTMTLSAFAMDPDAVKNDAEWRQMLTAEIESWGLTPSFW